MTNGYPVEARSFAARYSPVATDTLSTSIRVTGPSVNWPFETSIFCGAGTIAGAVDSALKTVVAERKAKIAKRLVLMCPPICLLNRKCERPNSPPVGRK
jgi:hypothetical protein